MKSIGFRVARAGRTSSEISLSKALEQHRLGLDAHLHISNLPGQCGNHGLNTPQSLPTEEERLCGYHGTVKVQLDSPCRRKSSAVLRIRIFYTRPYRAGLGSSFRSRRSLAPNTPNHFGPQRKQFLDG